MKNQKTKKRVYVPFLFSDIELAELSNKIFKQYDAPITLRQLFYRLVSMGLPNNRNSYTNLSKRMTIIRELGWVSWDKLIDLDRQIEKGSSWPNPEAFIRDVSRSYKRDLQQGQGLYLEVWCEKATAVRHITDKYDINLLAGGGYQSNSSLFEAAERFKDTGKPVKILYLGDFDPSGFDIQRAIGETLRVKFNIEVEIQRVLLLPEDIKKYDLLPNKAKDKDKRTPAYVKEFGFDAVYELDALPPDILANRLEEAICQNIDLKLYKRQVEQWETDNEEIGQFIKAWDTRESY